MFLKFSWYIDLVLLIIFANNTFHLAPIVFEIIAKKSQKLLKIDISGAITPNQVSGFF